MELLEATFESDSSYPLALSSGYSDAYRWMFWSRVIERLKLYVQDRGRQDELAKNALDQLRRAFLLHVTDGYLSIGVSPSGGIHWNPNPGLSLRESMPTPKIRDALIMIALETARSEYLRDSVVGAGDVTIEER